MAKRSKKKANVPSPDYQSRNRQMLKRTHRKTVLFNDRELALIDEYCRKYKVASKSALIRQSVLRAVMEVFDQNPPTLF